MDEAMDGVIATLDTGRTCGIKAFGGQYFVVALEAERQHDDEDEAEQKEGKVQLYQIDASGRSADVIQEIPAGVDSISCIDVAKVAEDGEGYYMSMSSYLDRQHNYYCVVYHADIDSDPSILQFSVVLSFKTDPDSERRQSCVRFDCCTRTEHDGVPKRLITATGNSIRVWDFPELLRRAATNGGGPLEFSAPLLEMTSPHVIGDVQLSPCGSVIAAIAQGYVQQSSVTLWDATSGQRVFTLEMPTLNEQPFEAVGIRFLRATNEDSVRFAVALTSPPSSASHASVVAIGEMIKRTHECILVNNEQIPDEKIRSTCVNGDASLIAVSTSVQHKDHDHLRVLDASLRSIFLEDFHASEDRSHIDFVQRDTVSSRLAELLSVSREPKDGIDRIRLREIPLPQQGLRIHELFTPTNMTLFAIFAVGVWLSFLFR